MPRPDEYPYENESQAPGVEPETVEVETTEDSGFDTEEPEDEAYPADNVIEEDE